MSGPHDGRPKINPSKEEKKQALESERIRNCIEGKFGQAKRGFSLNRVMTKLPHTSLTAISITFLVMNLSTHLLRVFYAFLCLFFQNKSFSEFDIIRAYNSVSYRQ